MPGEVKLPGVGNVKKTYAVAGGALLLGILGYAYYKHSKSSAAAAAAAAANSAAQPATTSQNIDPATGYPYGSPQDLAALQAEAGYGGFTGGGGGYYPVGGGGTTGTPAPGTTVGVPQIVGSAQATAIAAIQAAGLIPFPSSTESGMGNVSTQSPAAGTQVAAGSTVYWQASPGGPGGGGQVTVPNVVGQEVDAAQRALSAAGLTWTRPSLSPGVGYHVTGQTPAAGAQAASGSAVALTIAPNHK